MVESTDNCHFNSGSREAENAAAAMMRLDENTRASESNSSHSLTSLFGNESPSPLSVHVAQSVSHSRIKDTEDFYRAKLGDVEDSSALFGLAPDNVGIGLSEKRSQILDPELTKRLRQKTGFCGASVAAIFHAAWALVVSSTSGRNDVVFGIVDLDEVGSLLKDSGAVGLRRKSRPIRLRLENLTASELVDRAEKELLEVLCREIPAPETLLRCSAMPSAALLFSTLVVCQRGTDEMASADSIVSEATSDPYPGWPGVSAVLCVRDFGEGFSLEVQTERRIDPGRILAYFVSAIKSLTVALSHADKTPILALSILPARERDLILWSFNDTRASDKTNQLVHALFEEQVERSPDAVALVYERYSLSYQQLNLRANQLASYLRHRGVGPDQLVGVCVERSLEMVVALLAILKAGGAYVPFDPGYPSERLKYMLDDASPKVLLIQQELRPRLPPTRAEIIALDEEWDAIAQEAEYSSAARAEGPRARNLAYVIYTSGSTGKPKGAMNEHGAVVNRLRWMQRAYGLDERYRVLQKTPFSFDVSVWEFFWTLANGACLVIARPQGHRDPIYLTQLIEETGVTTVHFVPSMLQSFLSVHRSGDCPSLQHVVCSGEELAASSEQKCFECFPQVRLSNLYGPTEAAVDVTAWECRPEDDGSHVPIGRPISNTQIYILDRYRQPVPIGAVGEIYIGGMAVGRGYLNRPDLTAERFLAAGFVDDPQARLYKTGDLGRWRSDGVIEYLGRNDHQVKIRGFRIELGEIEARLLQHPQIKAAVVTAHRDEVGERGLVAYVVADPSPTAGAPSGNTSEELRKEIVGGWETLYQETYGAVGEISGPSFVGWNSSYTGQPIPESQMCEWVSCTVERIRALRPRRILEIGCGTGLLLQHLAPECETFMGTDISSTALDQLRRWAKGRKELHHVELLHRMATDLTGIPRGYFDTVVLNSVVQYFPDVDYLRTVLDGALSVLTRGGKIFLGDIRNLELQLMFHSAVQLSKAAASVTVGQLRKRVRRALAHEKELVLEPQFFQALLGRVSGISAVEMQLKRGRDSNELTRYRYDVVLHAGEKIEPAIVYEPIDWPTEIGSLAYFGEALQRRRWDAVCLRYIPNGRLSKELAAQRLIETADEQLEAAVLRSQLIDCTDVGIDPEKLWELGRVYGYDVQVTWSAHGSPECFEATLLNLARASQVARSILPAQMLSPWAAYANDPLESAFRQKLIPQLRTFLQERLPEYMIPSAWVGLKQLPLTPNGKLDRGALPAPQSRPEEIGEYIAPRTPMEHALAEIWGQLLRVDQVGIRDNFFELGGHSLSVVQMLERLRRAGWWADLRQVYTSPTLADLARSLTAAKAPKFEVPPNLIPSMCESITPSMLPLVELDAKQIEHIVKTVPQGAANVQDIYPLAPLQEGILFHHFLDKGRGGDTYVVLILLSLDSRGQLDQLIAALQTVIDRHDVLRTAVLWDRLPVPVQVVYRHAALPVTTLKRDPKRDALEQLKERMRPELQRLDLNRAPLMRLQVVEDGYSERWYALLQLHHLIQDYASVEILMSEVLACTAGRGPELPEPIQYRNHVAHTLNQARTRDFETFFRDKLTGITEVSAPFELLSVHGDGSRMEEAQELLELELAKRVRACAKSLSIGPAALFHAAWGLVVAATTARDDIVLGTVLLGRLEGAAQVERTLGLYVNTLPLRIRLAGVSAADLLKRTHQELLELMEHEQASLSVAQRCSGVGGSAPLFSTLLNYFHGAQGVEAVQARTHSGIEILGSQGWTNYPICLRIGDTVEGFSLAAQTDRRVDPRRIISFMRRALLSLVNALEHAPATRALSLSVLPKQERWQVTEGFNADRAVDSQRTLIHKLFELQVERTPHARAVVYQNKSLTYQELNHRANRLARCLRGRGVIPDQVVGLCADRSLDLVVGILAILKAGGAYVPLDPHYPPDRLAYVLSDLAPKVLLTQDRFRSVLPPTAAQVVTFEADLAEIALQDATNLEADTLGLRADHLAYVIYTSGSTGAPKGAMIEHRNVTRLFSVTRNSFQFDECDVWTLFHSFAFDFSVWELWGALLHGGRVVVVPHDTWRTTVDFWRLICAEGVTVLNQTPSAFAQLVSIQAHGGPSEHSLRVVIFGGEALELHTLKPWVARNGATYPRLVNMYGITETTVHVTYRELSAREIESAQDSNVGRALPDLKVYLLNSSREPVPIGVTGEIYVGGEGVSRGYLNRAALTAERFIANPFNGSSAERLYRSGDIGRWREDGTIEYLGRNDHQVKVRGFRIELGEIEAQLAKHPWIREVAVIVREDVPGEKRLIAYLVSKGLVHDKQALPVEILRQHASRALPDYMVPNAYVWLKKMPLTSNGKLDRRALPAPGREAYVSRQYEPPQNEVEEALELIWKSVLRVDNVGRDTSFFELGGHSLLALKALFKINSAFGLNLTVTDIYRAPTIQTLCKRIQEGEAPDTLIELQQEAILDSRMEIPVRSPRRAESLIFLTGATGFVGRFLLAELLKDTDAKILCLVRGASQAEAAQRLRNTLFRWGLWKEEFRQRVKAVAGELGLPRLGLDDAGYAQVCRDVDVIYHCATSMNHLETYTMAKSANVGGARELLHIATQGTLKLVNVVSTLSVFGDVDDEEHRVVDENSSIDLERHTHSEGYSGSKWVAERLFISASERGIPCNIFRLGLVWADTQLGRYDDSQRESRLFKSCLLSGYGIQSYRYTMAPTPVDYVARSIVFLASRYTDGRGIFHLASPAPEIGGIFERLNETAGTALKIVSYYRWLCEMKRLHQAGRSMPIVPLVEPLFSLDEQSLAEYQSGLYSRRTRIDCTLTYRELEIGGIVAPVLSDELLGLHLKRMRSEDASLHRLLELRTSAPPVTVANG